MIKSVFTAAAVLALIAPNAMADSRDTFDVEITYSESQLNVEQAIEAQARDACTYVEIGSYIKRIDTDCVAEIIENAKTGIQEKYAQIGEASPFTAARLTRETETSFQ
jgi:hypothetical protein